MKFEFSLYFILVIILLVDCTPDEDKFVRIYGNNVNTSGIWPRANEMAPDVPALKHICHQLHLAIWPYRVLDMHDAIVETKTLTFQDTKYVDIKADFLLCELRPMPSYSMFTKGLKPDCMFLCHKIGYGQPRVFKLANHVCGIEL